MDTLEWDNKNFQYGIDFHGKKQIKGWNLKKTDFPEGVKFLNPWRIYTPPGYSVLFITPTYQFEKRFTVLPGIVETDSYHSINFPTVWHTTKDAIIERGTPFIQVIPFKRSKWKSQISLMDTEDMRMEGIEKNMLNTKFKNAYRDIVARNKNAELTNSEQENLLLQQIKEARGNLFHHEMDEITEADYDAEMRTQWENVKAELQARVDRLEAKYTSLFGD